MTRMRLRTSRVTVFCRLTVFTGQSEYLTERILFRQPDLPDQSEIGQVLQRSATHATLCLGRAY
jgi:hypothetical protein